MDHQVKGEDHSDGPTNSGRAGAAPDLGWIGEAAASGGTCLRAAKSKIA